MNVIANIRPGKTSKRDLRYAIQTDFANFRRREATGCPGTTKDAKHLILRRFFTRRFSPSRVFYRRGKASPSLVVDGEVSLPRLTSAIRDGRWRARRRRMPLCRKFSRNPRES